ncbi:MAG: Lrp/AsnC family transcriptional regulator [Promethearchaeota archaeon]
MPHKRIKGPSELDEINRKILAILKKNARKPYKDIAEMLGVSESTVRKRVKILVESGVIKRFTIDINPMFPRQNITAFITLVPKEGKMNEVIQMVKNATHCSEAFCLSGKMGILMITGAENISEIDALVESYRVYPYIEEVTVGISLKNISTGDCIVKLPLPID